MIVHEATRPSFMRTRPLLYEAEAEAEAKYYEAEAEANKFDLEAVLVCQLAYPAYPVAPPMIDINHSNIIR